jgi:hypothetical protein
MVAPSGATSPEKSAGTHKRCAPRDKERFCTGQKRYFVLVFIKTVPCSRGSDLAPKAFGAKHKKMSATQREWRLLAAAGVVSIFLLYFLYLDSLQLQSQASRDYRVGTHH